VGTKRLGTTSTTHARRLLITLDSHVSASEIMSRASHLRSSNDGFIAANDFVHYDLSKEDSRLAYLRRVNRRESRQSDNLVNTELQAARAHPSPSIPAVFSLQLILVHLEDLVFPITLLHTPPYHVLPPLNH